MKRSNKTITRKNITLFLFIVLIAGTITTSFPSYLIDTAQAIPDHIIDNYKSKYTLYNKDIVKYNNFKLNFNVEEGLNLVNTILESLDNLVQTEIRDSKNIGSSNSKYGNSERYGYIDDKKDFTFAYSNNKDNEQLTPTPTRTTDENNVYVVWEDDSFGNKDILFAASTDNGQTFSTAENLSNNLGNARNPHISSEGSNVYVVWEDDSFGNKDILFAASTNNGQTFSTAENLSNNVGESEDSRISSSTLN